MWTTLKVAGCVGVNAAILALTYREEKKIRSSYERANPKGREAALVKEAVLRQNPMYAYGDPLMRAYVVSTYDPNSREARQIRFFRAQERPPSSKR